MEEYGGGPTRYTSETIFNELVDDIANGVHANGERLPTEKALTERFGVSRNTIRSVLSKLGAFGLIETKRGDGSYVR